MGDHKRRLTVVAGLGMLVVAAAAYPQAVRPSPAKPAGARAGAAKAAAAKAAAEAAAAEEERASKLAEGLAGTVKLLSEGDPAGGLQKLTAAAAGSWAQPFLERMSASVPVWAEMLAAAQENRSGDLAAASLKGHLIVDGLLSETEPKAEEYRNALMDFLISGSRDMAKLGQTERDLKISNAMRGYLVSALDTFDLALQVALQHGPLDVRRQAFEAIAKGLPEAKKTEGRLGSLLRIGYERESDPKAKAAAAARMKELSVPLTVPSPSPSPSPPPAEPKG